jgi:hypothetical protein
MIHFLACLALPAWWSNGGTSAIGRDSTARHRRGPGSPRPRGRYADWLEGMNRRSRILILFALVGGCSPSSLRSDVPKPVFVPTAARELRVANGVAPGQVDISYVVQAKYPAAEIRDGMARALRDGGYQLLDHDFLNPSRKLENPRDWSSYVDGTGRRETCVRELVEDWQTPHGDVVRYSLRYDSSCEAGPAAHRVEPTPEALRVSVGVIPAESARAAREALDRISHGRQ